MRIKNSPSREAAELPFETDSGESDRGVINSHWQKYLRFSAAYRSKKGHLDFNASGREGLGAFKKATMFARLRNFPSSLALSLMLSKYVPRPATLAAARELCKRMKVCFGFDQAKAEVFFDERCPFYEYWPSNIPPFYKNADGPTRHKLVRLDRT